MHITGAANGVQAGGNSVVGLTNVTIDGCQFGIGAGSGASVGVTGGSITGLPVLRSQRPQRCEPDPHLLVQDGGIIENNTGPGINLTGASSLRMRGGAIVRGNSGDGIHLSDTSVAEFGDDTSQITGNTGHGIACDGPPSVAVIRGGPGTVSGNASPQIVCQSAGG